MDYLKFKTNGNVNPKGKPRVYFTCHPDDFEKSFEKICNDIFKTHDCAIYYTENMADEYADDNWETDLNQMNLFVIPVTFRLLSTSNRTMCVDFRFAKANHIPVLPIMLESGIDDIYCQKENFGELQYLAPFEQDITAIRYEEKLKKYLESVLVSDEMVERILKAFDAYIFLSYRKTDRKFANELMRAIHANELCQSIAIWYDEFLTPGESFKENIQKLLEDSKLFALLVTPNLPKRRPSGEKNFVAEHEYPDAKKSGIEILPVEMQSTDKSQLYAEFEDIPECYQFDDEEDRARFVEAISHLAHQKSERSPEHNYLLGLAYLEGIDVEVNYELALQLLISAKNECVIDAINKLSDMYATGQAVEYDIARAAELKLIVVEYWRKHQNSQDDKERLFAELVNMAMLCLSGKQEKNEPSPGKLLSYGYGLYYYQEAIETLQEIISDTAMTQQNTLLMRTHIARFCMLLRGGSRELWSNLTKEQCNVYFDMWIQYAGFIVEQEEHSIEDMRQLREALLCYLEQIDYSNPNFEEKLNEAIEICIKICEDADANYNDYYSLLSELYNVAIPYNCGKQDYAATARWIEKYCRVLNALKKFIKFSAKKNTAEYQSLYINQFVVKCTEIIYTITKEGKNTEKKYARQILKMINTISEDYPEEIHSVFLKAAKKMVETEE